MQKLFTRNPIATILMPTTEDIRKLLGAGTLETKWINTIRHQVKRFLCCMSLKQLFLGHFHSHQVSKQSSMRAEYHSGITAACTNQALSLS